MEYRRKCNVCGNIWCYTDKDLNENVKNAAMGTISAVGGLASVLGGGSIFHTAILNSQANRYEDKWVDYERCNKCNSTDTELIGTWDSTNSKSGKNTGKPKETSEKMKKAAKGDAKISKKKEDEIKAQQEKDAALLISKKRWEEDVKNIEKQRITLVNKQIRVLKDEIEKELVEKLTKKEAEKLSELQVLEAESKQLSEQFQSLSFFDLSGNRAIKEKMKENENSQLIIKNTLQSLKQELDSVSATATKQANKKKKEIVQSVAQQLPLPPAPEGEISNPFLEKTFVVADIDDKSEDYWIRKAITNRGGTVVTSVTQKLDYLICTRVERGITTRIDAALNNVEKGFPTKLLTVKDFQKMVKQVPVINEN